MTGHFEATCSAHRKARSLSPYTTSACMSDASNWCLCSPCCALHICDKVEAARKRKNSCQSNNALSESQYSNFTKIPPARRAPPLAHSIDSQHSINLHVRRPRSCPADEQHVDQPSAPPSTFSVKIRRTSAGDTAKTSHGTHPLLRYVPRPDPVCFRLGLQNSQQLRRSETYLLFIQAMDRRHDKITVGCKCTCGLWRVSKCDGVLVRYVDIRETTKEVN